MFYVPAYQRGYRWGEVEVRRLLDDIWYSREKPYYLQPVVVKQHGDEWELVDGQQRLTTLFLIFQYMKRAGLQNSGWRSDPTIQAMLVISPAPSRLPSRFTCCPLHHPEVKAGF
jgi:uncharacterized protein with ParB-like and HNH nuclease domain